MRKIFRLIRSLFQRIKKNHGEKIVKRPFADGNLYLWSKRSHVRSNELEIIRMASYVNNCEGKLVMVDVGANIGVVTLLTYQHLRKGSYLCIDGNNEFFPLLQKNMKQIPDATCENVYLSDRPERKAIDTKTYVNTACILESSTGQGTDFRTLDEICESKDMRPNFVKIDTDGYDAKVLRGFSKHLSSVENVVLYFEYAPMHQVFNRIEKRPEDLFDYLHPFGYDDFHFFDDQGNYICLIHFDEKTRIQEMTQYCLSGCKLFNVLTYHKNNLPFKEAFIRGEKDQQQKSQEKWEAWWAKH